MSGVLDTGFQDLRNAVHIINFALICILININYNLCCVYFQRRSKSKTDVANIYIHNNRRGIELQITIQHARINIWVAVTIKNLLKY